METFKILFFFSIIYAYDPTIVAAAIATAPQALVWTIFPWCPIWEKLQQQFLLQSFPSTQKWYQHNWFWLVLNPSPSADNNKLSQ